MQKSMFLCIDLKSFYASVECVERGLDPMTTSITYKLKWNGGDMKSVQGDSGHSRMDMVAEVYSHIIDEDRRFNAQKFEEQFYQTKGLRNVEEGQTVPMPSFSSATELKKNETSETEELVAKLLNNPEALSLLKAIANKL